MILDGVAAGFKHIVVDKPVCISKDDIPALKQVKEDVAVCHGFRQQWGPQTIKKMIDAGEFGELISIEGRYWQSSHAQAALAGTKKDSTKDWKNDPAMNGPYDALVDLGAHYTDLMFFLAGSAPTRASGWVSHVNSPAPHRDAHAWVEFQFPQVRARGSISKTAHGRGNDLEITVLGAKQAATWGMERSDELRISRGATTTVMQKPSDKFGSQQPPFHGMGWIEGYIEIIHNYLMKIHGNHSVTYPTLQESLRVMETLLNLEVR
jgi:predicted dehydrogenase